MCDRGIDAAAMRAAIHDLPHQQNAAGIDGKSQARTDADRNAGQENLSEDCAIVSRDLFRHETQPGRSRGLLITHRRCRSRPPSAGDNRSMPGERSPTVAPGILPRKGCDLVKWVIGRLIEPVPVFGQTFNNACYARRQHIGRSGEVSRRRMGRAVCQIYEAAERDCTPKPAISASKDLILCPNAPHEQ
jgi:hypothetical protein